MSLTESLFYMPETNTTWWINHILIKTKQNSLRFQLKKLLDNLIQSESPSVESDSLQPHGLHSPWNSPGQNMRVGSCSLLQGIFPTLGLNSGFLHSRQILYQLSPQARAQILEWVAYPFSSRSFQPRNRTRVSSIAGRFFTSWATREAPSIKEGCKE